MAIQNIPNAIFHLPELRFPLHRVGPLRMHLVKFHGSIGSIQLYQLGLQSSLEPHLWLEELFPNLLPWLTADFSSWIAVGQSRFHFFATWASVEMLTKWQLDSPKVAKMEGTSFYNLISDMTFHYICHYGSHTPTPGSWGRRQYMGVDNRKWESLGVTVEAGDPKIE